MAVILGSATVFATGLLSSAQRLNDSLSHIEAVQVQVVSPPPGVLAGGPAEEPGVRQQKSGTRMSDAEVEAFLRTLPGAKYVTSQREADTAVGGLTETAALYAYTGDSAHLGYELLSGRWFSGAGEAVVSPEMLRLTGKSVGDTLTLTLDGHAVAVRIVGEAFAPVPRSTSIGIQCPFWTPRSPRAIGPARSPSWSDWLREPARRSSSTVSPAAPTPG